MIQFNLLPDVKLEYIKAQRTRRLVITVSILVTTVSVVLLVLLLGIGQIEKKHSSDLSKDIRVNSNKLKAEPQIDRVLTVQNQLESLTGLHDQKPALTKVFDYFNQITPAKVSINTLTVDTVAHTVTVTGTADALSSVNQFVDTLKFTKYSTTGKTEDEKVAFSNVVLSEFSVASNDSNSTDTTAKVTTSANYNITAGYDVDLFNIKDIDTLKLNVPNIVTTRSAQDKPADLFTGDPASSTKPTEKQ